MAARKAPGPLTGAAGAPISALRNIGPRSAGWLVEVGVATRRDLERLGPAEAWRRAKRAHPREVSLNLLWALAGGLLDCDWRELPEELRQGLLRESRGAAPARRGAK